MSQKLETDLAPFATAFIASASAPLLALGSDKSFARMPGAAPSAH